MELLGNNDNESIYCGKYIETFPTQLLVSLVYPICDI